MKSFACSPVRTVKRTYMRGSPGKKRASSHLELLDAHGRLDCLHVARNVIIELVGVDVGAYFADLAANLREIVVVRHD